MKRQGDKPVKWQSDKPKQENKHHALKGARNTKLCSAWVLLDPVQMQGDLCFSLQVGTVLD